MRPILFSFVECMHHYVLYTLAGNSVLYCYWCEGEASLAMGEVYRYYSRLTHLSSFTLLLLLLAIACLLPQSGKIY